MFVDNRVDQIPRKQIFFFSNLRDTRDTNCSVKSDYVIFLINENFAYTI